MPINERIKRICSMERCFDQVSEAFAAGTIGSQTEAKIRLLQAYMDGGLWLEDYASDERGELPADLKRGVLSEDGLYNLLNEIEEKGRNT